MRKLTTYEKAQLLNYRLFQDVCELEALEAAKFWDDYIPREGDDLVALGKVKFLSAQMLSSGSVDRQGITKTWLVLNDNPVEVVEKEDYGLQLSETVKNLLTLGDGEEDSLMALVMKQTIARRSAPIDAPPAEIPAAAAPQTFFQRLFG